MDQSLRLIDADNHYYEALDACTRYLDPEFKRRGVRIVQQGKRTMALMGDQVNHFIPNPTFDPIIIPGCLDPMFRGQVPEGVDPRSLMQVEPIHPEYRDHDARLRVLDEQGIDGALLFPTFACGVEQGLRFDIPALMATLHARLKPGADAEASIRAIKQRLAKVHGISHATVEIESGEACPDLSEGRRANGTA